MKKKVIDNKQFWKTIKPLISDKPISRDRINLIENKEIVKSESETVQIFNKFFSNIAKNLCIPVYNDFDPIIENMKGLVLKAVLKYKNRPSILAIRDTQKIVSFVSKK